MNNQALIIKEVKRLLGAEHVRLTPTKLFQAVKTSVPNIDRPFFRSTIRLLVESGDLVYTSQLSTSHLELGRITAARISDRVTIAYDSDGSQAPDGAGVLRLKAGAAFGGGDHPTTCLSLRGIDYLLSPLREKATLYRVALDIGTGTGILAIAAARLGVDQVIALDIDPAACHEAGRNVQLNNLTNRVSVVCGGLETIPRRKVDLVLANLRPPTLASLFPEMVAMTSGNGYWVLSGFRPEEGERLKRRFPDEARVVWAERERNWAAMAVKIDKPG